MQRAEETIQAAKQSMLDAEEVLERAEERRRVRDSHRQLARELRERQPRGRSGVRGSQR